MDIYAKGSAVRISATFKTGAGVVSDPTGVLLKVLSPDAAISTLTYGVDEALIKDSTGNYHADIIADQVGRYEYRWEGSGVIVAAAEGYFEADSSKFP